MLKKIIGRLSAVAGAVMSPEGERTMLEKGSQAPDFEVAAHDGTTVKLSDLRGKKVILWFYPKADTPG